MVVLIMAVKVYCKIFITIILFISSFKDTAVIIRALIELDYLYNVDGMSF